MKRLFLSAALATSIFIFTGCAQHDPTSPDSGGAVPKDQPGAGVDTSSVSNQPNTGGAANGSNDGTNNNQQMNTGDTAKQKQ